MKDFLLYFYLICLPKSSDTYRASVMVFFILIGVFFVDSKKLDQVQFLGISTLKKPQQPYY
ncbi:hypothetical protein KCTC52924_00949 [Arenibacter antarcticus]